MPRQLKVSEVGEPSDVSPRSLLAVRDPEMERMLLPPNDAALFYHRFGHLGTRRAIWCGGPTRRRPGNTRVESARRQTSSKQSRCSWAAFRSLAPTLCCLVGGSVRESALGQKFPGGFMEDGRVFLRSIARVVRTFRRPEAQLALLMLLNLCCDSDGVRRHQAVPTPSTSNSNTEAVRRYHKEIVAYSGANVVTENCEMFGDSRVGRCLVRGTPVQVDKLIASLPLDVRSDGPPSGPSCADLPVFGIPKNAALPSLRQFLPGVRFLWRRGPDAGGPRGFPGNRDNVVLRAAYLDPQTTYVCIEYEYPSG